MSRPLSFSRSVLQCSCEFRRRSLSLCTLQGGAQPTTIKLQNRTLTWYPSDSLAHSVTCESVPVDDVGGCFLGYCLGTYRAPPRSLQRRVLLPHRRAERYSGWFFDCCCWCATDTNANTHTHERARAQPLWVLLFHPMCALLTCAAACMRALCLEEKIRVKLNTLGSNFRQKSAARSTS